MRYLVLSAMICLSLILANAVSYAESWDENAAESEAASEMAFDEEMAATEMGGSMSGKVVSVNARGDAFSVKSEEYGGRIYRFTVSDETAFEICESLRDLSGGDSVTVDYYTMGDNNVAENVTLDKRAYREDEPLPELEKPLVD